ncbi:MAG: iron ABC transporter permease [Rhodospirillum sp.]|nr:iron ABC transporter permease [Rhodospirillum sp.]MCF8490907.1 iron ABC transporter permease [Rhodospirillum sp.]MCF8499090.1 iron ABC transporter permease [Rhodospirillum sp.]
MPPIGVLAQQARRNWRWSPSVWTLGAAGAALIVAIPVVAVVVMALMPGDPTIWPHLAKTVLPTYVINTLFLMTGVGLGTFLIGTGTAWLVTLYRFPGSRLFEWALLVPLSVPAFIIGFTYTELLDYAGPVQGTLRTLFGWSSPQAYWFPEIRSLGGAVAMMTLVLYPYVYLLARSAFLEQSQCTLEVSRTLGCTPWQGFRRVALPLARPSLAVGLALVLMETLNDYGTVKLFGVQTLTNGMYNIWLIMGNRAGGAQVACVLLLFIMGLIILERWARAKKAYQNTGTRMRPVEGKRLTGLRAGFASLACALPVLLGFVVPASVLARNAVLRLSDSWTPAFVGYATNSLGLSLTAALVALSIGLFMAYAVRLGKGETLKWFTRLASLGYAIPGTVLAIGILAPFGAFDNAVDRFMRETFDISTGLLLSGTLFALVFAYVVRFLALSYGTVEAGLGRVRPTVDMAARTLGCGPGKVLLRVHLPIIKGSLLTAILLVFVDCMKELPATLLLRPFNFDTLATHVFQFASSEQIEQAALGALAIVAAGLLPVILLSRSIAQSRDWSRQTGDQSPG